MVDYGKALSLKETPIPGLQIWDVPIHGDHRGWFKENWQRKKMADAGLPDFEPVQNNVSFNLSAGTTRGIHAEPWDKWVSLTSGRVFGAWVDLRAGPDFGTVFTTVIEPSRAVFVPRGVGNAFQTLEPNTAYTYLVNDHYSAEVDYTSLNLADEAIAIDWPIPLKNAQISAKDRLSPSLAQLSPILPKKILVLGSNGQVGSALRELYAEDPNVEFLTREDFDLAASEPRSERRWKDYETIINAAAYTAVDEAETPTGRKKAWATNVIGVTALSQIAITNGLKLVHISSDYVFDGTATVPYTEDDPISPLSVYGQTKAAGEAIVATVPRHYIIRTSWLIGKGPNFVRTMLGLATRGINPRVVDDQWGRLTFASELARAIKHLIATSAPYGIYNVSGAGQVMSWADIARRTFTLAGHDPARISGVSTEQYSLGKLHPIAPRPRWSVLDVGKLESTNFSLADSDSLFDEYVTTESPNRT